MIFIQIFNEKPVFYNTLIIEEGLIVEAQTETCMYENRNKVKIGRVWHRVIYYRCIGSKIIIIMCYDEIG